MRSRMERYYSNETENNERVKKHGELYDTIYRLDPLADVEDVNNVNEIDLESLKNISNRSREEYHKLEEYKRILNAEENEEEFELTPEEKVEEKVYDINSILEKAKMDREPLDNKDNYRKLKNTQYDILNSLNIGEKTSDIEYKEENENHESDTQRLKNLINTITMNKKEIEIVMKKDGGNNLLTDLMPMDNTIVTESINETTSIEDDVNHEKDNNESALKIENVDQSFYTSSLSFSKTDFEGVKNLESTVKVNNVLIKVLLFILIVIITTVILFVVNNYIDLNLFKK
jgi:hypothetical protein